MKVAAILTRQCRPGRRRVARADCTTCPRRDRAPILYCPPPLRMRSFSLATRTLASPQTVSGNIGSDLGARLAWGATAPPPAQLPSGVVIETAAITPATLKERSHVSRRTLYEECCPHADTRRRSHPIPTLRLSSTPLYEACPAQMSERCRCSRSLPIEPRQDGRSGLFFCKADSRRPGSNPYLIPCRTPFATGGDCPRLRPAREPADLSRA